MSSDQTLIVVHEDAELGEDVNFYTCPHKALSAVLGMAPFFKGASIALVIPEWSSAFHWTSTLKGWVRNSEIECQSVVRLIQRQLRAIAKPKNHLPVASFDLAKCIYEELAESAKWSKADAFFGISRPGFI